MSDTDTASLHVHDHAPLSLPHHQATLGHDVIEVSSLLQHQLFTYDPGFMATAACKSDITYIDGEAGQLLYRGYPIEQLAEQHTYMDVAHLLLQGALPESTHSFEKTLCEYSTCEPEVWAFLTQLSSKAHPVGMLLASLAYCAAHHSNTADQSEARTRSMLQAVGILPTLAAACLRRSQNLPPLKPKPELGYINNFLYMSFDQTEFDPAITHALDVIFTLHADHEQNASTSTVRMAGSTGTPAFAALSAGVAALWGRAHGGANEACLKMLHEIQSAEHVPEYLIRAKDKSDPFRLMGFGHRVYKNYDPRARIMRDICHSMIDLRNQTDTPLFTLASTLESLALEDPYFIDKKLYPNVDFYSGLTLDALGFPSDFFTVIFAVARTVGWASHWLEMMDDPEFRINRPRQWYTGPTTRDCPKAKDSEAT